MKVFLILALLLAVGSCQINDPAWDLFKNSFNKKYENTNVESMRYGIFKKNIVQIEQHNLRYNQGHESYTKGINQFSDLTEEEIRRTYLGYKAGSKFNETGSARLHQRIGTRVPASIDWRTKGVVTPVKDQGSCGSCWAFSTTGVLEGQHALATKKLVSLSEQNLVDCTKERGNYGCEGGWPFDSYEYIIRFSSGLDTEAAYPYKGVDQTCAYDPTKVGATATAFSVLPPNDETCLQEAVATVGPISVCINANGNFMGYSGGVFDDPTCTSDFDSIDHCVLAVGYGTDQKSGKDYWLVKNSWNKSWGEQGYIKMVRNKKNQCAISTLASYPDVKPTN